MLSPMFSANRTKAWQARSMRAGPGRGGAVAVGKRGRLGRPVPVQAGGRDGASECERAGPARARWRGRRGWAGAGERCSAADVAECVRGGASTVGERGRLGRAVPVRAGERDDASERRQVGPARARRAEPVWAGTTWASGVGAGHPGNWWFLPNVQRLKMNLTGGAHMSASGGREKQQREERRYHAG